MRAFVLEDFDSEPALRDLPQPEPGEGQVAVRVNGSSVNPVDNAVASGGLRGMAEYEFPVILGRDFAGVVEEVGDAVDAYAKGDQVFGFLGATDPEVHNGAWTEIALVPTAGGYITKKPAEVDFASAGAASVAALTALAAVNALELKEGETVLIVGATGGVGSFAVQLAKRAGAQVIAPGLPEDKGYLVDLGADHVIPRDGDVAAQARGLESVAALIDTVSYSPQELEVYAAALAQGGRVASPTGAAGEGPGRHNVNGSGADGAIEQLARLLADGALRVPIQRTYPLEDAGTALSDLAGEHTQGKLAIAVAA